MADQDESNAITLVSWPTSKDCLAWSDDGLAVACNETLYVLSPKTTNSNKAPSGSSRWHINTIPANTFTLSEWPYFQLATIKHFSIGEEQSASAITALSWSRPGLGIHKRSVLAVLTSNLILSLWETDGSLEPYRRTCIVNSALLSDDAQAGFGVERRTGRIRAYTWSVPIVQDGPSKIDNHSLIIADDTASIIVLQIEKISPGQYGGWKINILQRIQLPENDSETRLSITSPLQRLLFSESPVTRIEQSTWTKVTYFQAQPSKMVFSCFLELHSAMQIRRIRMFSSAETLSSGVDGKLSITIELQYMDKLTAGESEMLKNGLKASQSHDKLELDFKESIQPLYNNFNDTHELFGNVRVRFWGHDQSPDYSSAAACVTIHPTDVIEHTIPSAEKTFVIFRKTGPAKTTASHIRSKDDVLQRFVTFVAASLKQSIPLVSALDEKVSRIYHQLITEQNSKSTSHAVSKCSTTLQPAADHVQVQSVPQSEQPYPEVCDICNQGIPFPKEPNSARCLAGHQFTRCNLSFVSIQEPGISKYCSECGKQFLDLSKLGMSSGPGLSNALFDAFDVCPYCQARFRS